MDTKKTKRTYDFNISYSALSLFNSCQRNFYYTHIAKIRGKDGLTAYGDAGNVCHSVLEHKYFSPITEAQELFEKLWKEKKLDSTNLGMFGIPLKFEVFWNAVLAGRARKYKIIRTEEKLQFKDDHLIKGFLDVVAHPEEHNFTPKELAYLEENKDLYDDVMCCDWKTNSNINEGHVGQMQFYAYLWFRKYKKLPKKFIWDYIKIGKRLERIMTMDDVYVVRDKINAFLDGVYSRKTFAEWKPSPDGMKTNCSDGACKFCSHQERCKNDMVSKEEEQFKLYLKKGKIYFGNQTTAMFNDIIDKYFSYEIPNKDFVVRAVKKKSGREWDGIVHMKKNGAYPIGLLNKLKYYIAQYADATKKHCSIEVIDQRKEFEDVQPLMDKLKGIELRYYQAEAVNQAMRNKMGIISVPTGGGKTIIGAELYRQNPTKTLFVVDRKFLLAQTVKEFEEVLDMKDQVGTIESGTMNLKGNLTVATIQTIASRVKKKDKEMLKYLDDVEMIITDEAHIAKANSYDQLFSKAPNSRIRIGLTGTPADDAQNALELHKNLGYVIYRIPVQTLIEEETIMKPIIKFMKYDSGFMMEGDFNDIREQLLENEERNQLIIDTAVSHKGDVQLILVDRIAHGRLLQEQLEEKGLESFFIQGSVPDKLREEMLDDARNKHPRVLIGTSSIVSKGLNLKPLQVIINATGNATSIMTIQSLGRILRTDEGKEYAMFYDIYDEIDYFFDHTMQRIKAFEKDGHEVLTVESKVPQEIKGSN